jgi:hypothetical protein
VEEYGLPDEPPATITDRWLLRWCLLQACPVVIAVLVALFLPDNLVTTRLELALNLVGVIATILPQAELAWRARQGRQVRPGGRSAARRRRRRPLIAGSVAAAALVAASIAWDASANADLDVTGAVSLSPGEGIRPGQPVSLRIPGRPPARHHITVTPILDNPTTTGDCERTAWLDLTAVVDERPRATATTRSGVSVDLPLVDAVRTAHVVITVRHRDRNCVMGMRIGKAVLHD